MRSSSACYPQPLQQGELLCRSVGREAVPIFVRETPSSNSVGIVMRDVASSNRCARRLGITRSDQSCCEPAFARGGLLKTGQGRGKTPVSRKLRLQSRHTTGTRCNQSPELMQLDVIL